MTVRAKFRCMSTTRTWEGLSHTDFRPVKTGSGPDDPADAENRRYWKWTPSGELSMRWRGLPPYDPGAYFYIDLEPRDPETVTFTGGKAEPKPKLWTLQFIGQRDNQLDVELAAPWAEKPEDGEPMTATLKMGIDNKDAWPHFIANGVGSTWTVKLTPAS